MSRQLFAYLAVAILAAALATAISFRLWHPAQAPAAAAKAQILYWYDPMRPEVHYDHPGRSPSMDMPLQAKYADTASLPAARISLSGQQQQELAVRTGMVERASLAPHLRLAASIAFDERQLSVIQLRSAGYVERAYAYALGDTLARGAPLADIRMPAWSAAQAEYLELLKHGPEDLLPAARERLLQLGMSPALLQELDRKRQVQDVVRVSAPRAGVLLSYEVRPGMSLAANDTLARINAIDKVWLQVFVPQAQAGSLRLGLPVQIRIPGLQRRRQARIEQILPAMDASSHDLGLRIGIDNPQGRLHPGMYADVDLDLPTLRDQLWVPRAAVIRTGQSDIVFVDQGQGHFQPVEVKTGVETEDKLQILQGLQAGQSIATRGQFMLDSEASLDDIKPKPLAPAAMPAMAMPGGSM